MFKKIFALITAAALCLTLSSCGKKGQVPELTEDGKKIVKVYAMRIGSAVYENIRLFNQFNNEYEVQITEFSVEYSDNPIDQFNAAMAAGKYPDVIMYDEDGQFPIEHYAQKGMLADFYEFIDNDPDLSRDDFSDVFKAFEWDGGLYRIFTSFFILSAAGKTSVVGKEQGITLDRFIELINEYPDSPFSDEGSDGVLSTLMTYGYENFIDTANGECRFDSEEFIKLLEFCKQFPTTPEALSELEFHEAQLKERYAKLNGTMPFDFVYFYNFRNIRTVEHLEFCDPVTFIGFPGAGGNGSAIQPNGSKFSVLAKGANPDGGWAFVKYFLTGSRQNEFANSGPFAVRRSVLEEQAKFAKKLVWDSDENEYVEPYYIIGESGKKEYIGVNTDEDNQRVYDLISGAVEMKYSTEIINIVREEAGAYFSGQKSAKGVAEIIQNRVQNYIDESR
ncbi:MAG: extracellular solute-binding protein [Oscillospiraceae bacterium]|nr:extracellular solute-binding protein [Oscillospiraceae bacterium]